MRKSTAAMTNFTADIMISTSAMTSSTAETTSSIEKMITSTAKLTISSISDKDNLTASFGNFSAPITSSAAAMTTSIADINNLIATIKNSTATTTTTAKINLPSKISSSSTKSDIGMTTSALQLPVYAIVLIAVGSAILALVVVGGLAFGAVMLVKTMAAAGASVSPAAVTTA